MSKEFKSDNYSSKVFSLEDFLPDFSILDKKTKYSQKDLDDELLERFPKKGKIKVLFLDADRTLWNCHLSEELDMLDVEPGEETKKDVQEIIQNSDSFFKHKERFCSLIKNSIINGDPKLAILSYSRYKNAIKLALVEMGLTRGEVDELVIINGYPKEGGKIEIKGRPATRFGKDLHIQAALIELSEEGSRIEERLLLDDDKLIVQNTTLATAIRVPDNGFNPEVLLGRVSISTPTKRKLSSDLSGVRNPKSKNAEPNSSVLDPEAEIGEPKSKKSNVGSRTA